MGGPLFAAAWALSVMAACPITPAAAAPPTVLNRNSLRLYPFFSFFMLPPFMPANSQRDYLTFFPGPKANIRTFFDGAGSFGL
jgi:hypothetical protein